jgi:2-polyprenyl-6-methoxyphenol hydroxylase-like FAD-dependent oxidoreductase
MNDRALIVGAGIAGLATAIALQRTGREVLVLERAPALWEVGAGISLWPNAVKALRLLDIGDAVEAAGAPAHDAAFRSWRGTQLGPSITRQLQGRFGAPLVLVHRARLQMVMRRALGPDAIRLGAECASFEQDEDGATVCLVDGGIERGAFVIGADGLHSRVRSSLFADGPPRYAGLTAWRGVVPVDDALRRRTSSGESFGGGSLFGVARLNGSQAYWWASTRRDEGDGEEAATEKAALLRAFSDWHAPIPDLVAATPPEAIIRTCLYDRAPLERLSVGRIALSGDAAHPMLPNLGQGACQAIEDSVVLADALAATDDVIAALRCYSARRVQHTATVVRASRHMSRIAHLRNPLAAGLRNGLLRASPASISLHRLKPIVGHLLNPATIPTHARRVPDALHSG